MTPLILRLEVEAMKATMLHAFATRSDDLTNILNAQLEIACQPDRINEVFQTAVDKYLKAAIDEEIKSFFSYDGEGRKLVAAAVLKRLKTQASDSPVQ